MHLDRRDRRWDVRIERERGAHAGCAEAADERGERTRTRRGRAVDLFEAVLVEHRDEALEHEVLHFERAVVLDVRVARRLERARAEVDPCAETLLYERAVPRRDALALDLHQLVV